MEASTSVPRAYPMTGKVEMDTYTVDYLIVHTVGLRKSSCTLGGMQEARVTHGVTRLLICDTKQRLVVRPSMLTTM